MFPRSQANTHKKHCRNMMATWTSQPMHGHPWTTRCLSHSLFTLNIKGPQSQCCSILLRWWSCTWVLTLPKHLQRSWRILESKTRYVSYYNVIKVLLTFAIQLLSITCNNAANNDTIIEHLSTLIDNFLGAPNQMHCFTHILNLVVKSVLHQFDVAKKSGLVDSEQLDDATRELALLAQELDLGPDGADNDKKRRQGWRGWRAQWW